MNRNVPCRRILGLLFALSVCVLADGAGRTLPAAELFVGAATADITPPLPVALTGFQSVRLTRKIESRLAANVLALESREGTRVIDQAILVACDLCSFRPDMQEAFRKQVAPQLPGFDVNKLVLTATHTHSSPVIGQNDYDAKDYGDAMQPKDYVPLLYQRITEAVVRAWQSRAKGAMAYGLGHAVVGHNRRISYADGSAKMMGPTNDPQFRHVEGYEDHAVQILCFYDGQKRMKAAALALACPAQMSQGDTVVSADYWHYARERMRERFGSQLCVVGFCSPAGDQCPHLSLRKASEARMDRMRGLTRTQELGRRVADTFCDVATVIAKDIRTDVPLVHLVRQVDLPTRTITAEEYAIAKKVCDTIDAKKQRDKKDAFARIRYGDVCERYQAQQKGKLVYAMELHALRLGDVAVATNVFELYLDYGVEIQARSPAVQTFLIQLAAPGRQRAPYVPTRRAVDSGRLTEAPMNNYSATVFSDILGPDGGQALVDRTLEAIGSLWNKPAM
jgi:hypothetical protein